MALTAPRDLDRVVAGFLAWQRARHDDEVLVTGVERPTQGWSSETFLVRATVGGRPEGFALRLPPVGAGLFPTCDLGLQAQAHAVAATAGVPAPTPVEVVEDPSWLGSAFLLMPLIAGHVPGEMAAFDPWVRALDDGRRRALYEHTVDTLVVLHRHDPAAADGLPRRGNEDELAWWADYLAWYADGDEAVPALADALAWCADRRPAAEPPPAVLWGDVRLGNIVFADDATVTAVLDWEMATVGAPEHDLGWWLGLEAMQDELVGGRGDGFPSLVDLRARYEAGLGRPLQDLDWYLTFALFRSAAILTRIGILQQRAGQSPRMPLRENPVLDHLTRRLQEAP